MDRKRTQSWFPPTNGASIHDGVPTMRAGMPTARMASTRKIESPVHDAFAPLVSPLGPA